MRKVQSQGSYMSDMGDDVEHPELEANMQHIDEFYYGVRIFPGQDPAQVHVGWVTPQYREFATEFDVRRVRNVVVCSLDADYQLRSSVSRTSQRSERGSSNNHISTHAQVQSRHT